MSGVVVECISVWAAATVGDDSSDLVEGLLCVPKGPRSS